MLQVGQAAPEFALEDHTGAVHDLADARGSWLVLYFYPKDDTPGCTVEACEFRDNLGQLTSQGAKVFGLSADDRASHEKFAAKHELNFPLLIDPDLSVIKAYEAYGQKSAFGKTFDGVFRMTYLIDPHGKIAKVWAKVKPEGHALEVREAIETLSAAQPAD